MGEIINIPYNQSLLELTTGAKKTLKMLTKTTLKREKKKFMDWVKLITCCALSEQRRTE